MEKWEYKMVRVTNGEEEFLRRLNEEGEQGWEAVNFTGPNHPNFFTALLKRKRIRK